MLMILEWLDLQEAIGPQGLMHSQITFPLLHEEIPSTHNLKEKRFTVLMVSVHGPLLQDRHKMAKGPSRGKGAMLGQQGSKESKGKSQEQVTFQPPVI